MAHKAPGIKVLEVGAGTGGNFSKESLEAISWQREAYENSYSGVSSYHYTTSTSSALERVQEQCMHRLYASFGLLNIEIDPAEQGFEAETYDILVASNPRRPNGSIEVIMEHMLKLLKIGGRVLLFREHSWDDDDKCEYQHWREELTINGFRSSNLKLPYNVLKSSDDFVVLRKFGISMEAKHE